MINVLSENKVAFDAAPAPPLSSNSMRNKGWIEQWLSYVKNLGISVRLEVVKAIQTATVSLRVGGHIYITHKNSGAVICVPPDNDSVAASDPDIEEMWENVTAIDPSVDPRETLNKGNLSSKPHLVNFLNHCCRQRHYFFEIKKCGESSCTICKPVRLPDDIFRGLMHLPDPTPCSDGHYKPFTEIFGKETSENHRPSLQKKPKKKKTLPFHGVLQHVKNANMMLECEECGMWRLLYAKSKLSVGERTALQQVLDKWSFTCGTQLQDRNLTGCLADVYVREMSCNELIERLLGRAGASPTLA